MKARSIARSGLFAALFTFGMIGIAEAQASRTWVSGVGDDANPCSRTAPCRTFAGAIAKTAAAGVVNVIDPGDYGPVTITSSLTIDGLPQRGGITGGIVDGTTGGIVVDAGPNDQVVLRSLALRGDGTGSGIAFRNGKSLVIDGCIVSGFDHGIDVQHGTGASLLLSDVVSVDNKSTGLRAQSAAGSLLGSFAHTHFDRNGFGVLAGPGARLSLYESVASGNTTGIAASLDASGGTADVNLEHVDVSSNGVGIHASALAGTALVRMSKVLATDNETSTSVENGGSILSFGNNRLDVLATIALSSTTPSQSGAAGTAVTYPVNAKVTGILADPIAFACTGLPPGIACQIDPVNLPGGTANGLVDVLVTSTGPKSALNLSTPSSSFPTSMAALLVLPLLGGFGRRRGRFRLGGPLMCLALVSLTGVSACGSGDSASPGGPTDAIDAGPNDNTDSGSLPSRTAPGSYPFKVTAGSGPAKASLDLTLVVQ
jgi:hypothetical protein